MNNKEIFTILNKQYVPVEDEILDLLKKETILEFKFRHLVKRIITEAMKSPSSLVDDYAIYTNYNDQSDIGDITFILYNSTKATETLLEDLETEKEEAEQDEEEWDPYGVVDLMIDAMATNIVAILQVENMGDTCNRAWQVVRSAAESGFGPTIYDIAMGLSPDGLVADRRSVSGEAKSVWRFYGEKRDDVEKTYLDDTNNPITYWEDDDCLIHGKSPPIATGASYIADTWLHDNYPDVSDQLMSRMEEIGYNLLDFSHSDIIEKAQEIATQSDDDLAEEIGNEWNSYFEQNERNLFDLYPPNFWDDKIPLNISYNHSQHESAFYGLEQNHNEFMQLLEIHGMGEVGEWDWDHDQLEFMARDFFKGKY